MLQFESFFLFEFLNGITWRRAIQHKLVAKEVELIQTLQGIVIKSRRPLEKAKEDQLSNLKELHIQGHINALQYNNDLSHRMLRVWTHDRVTAESEEIVESTALTAYRTNNPYRPNNTNSTRFHSSYGSFYYILNITSLHYENILKYFCPLLSTDRFSCLLTQIIILISHRKHITFYLDILIKRTKKNQNTFFSKLAVSSTVRMYG